MRRTVQVFIKYDSPHTKIISISTEAMDTPPKWQLKGMVPDEARYKLFTGPSGARGLLLTIDTDYAQKVSVVVYIGNLKSMSIGLDASELTLEHLNLGNFEEYPDNGRNCPRFGASLPHKGEYAYLIVPDKLEYEDNIYYSNQFKTDDGRDGQALLYRCNGDEYFKVTEALSHEEERIGISAKHYKCVTVKSKEGRLMNLQEEGDKDLVTLISSIEVELEDEEVCRGGKHEVALLQSDIDAVQDSGEILNTELASKEHYLTFRVYCDTVE